jgi:hypothetical protein
VFFSGALYHPWLVWSIGMGNLVLVFYFLFFHWTPWFFHNLPQSSVLSSQFSLRTLRQTPRVTVAYVRCRRRGRASSAVVLPLPAPPVSSSLIDPIAGADAEPKFPRCNLRRATAFSPPCPTARRSIPACCWSPLLRQRCLTVVRFLPTAPVSNLPYPTPSGSPVRLHSHCWLRPSKVGGHLQEVNWRPVLLSSSLSTGEFTADFMHWVKFVMLRTWICDRLWCEINGCIRNRFCGYMKVKSIFLC